MAEAAVAAAFERGNAAVADGEKCLKKFSFFDKTGKFDDAAECFSLAGKSFLIAKSWPEAGANFARAADIYSTKLKVDHEAASAHQKAAEAYAKEKRRVARAMLHSPEMTPSGQCGPTRIITRDTNSALAILMLARFFIRTGGMRPLRFRSKRECPLPLFVHTDKTATFPTRPESE